MRKSTIFLLILVAFLFVSLLFSLYLNFNKSPAASIPTPTPNIVPTETTNETVNWKTYTNKIYNISFQYPSIFSVSDELPKTKTQGGPKTALELTDSKNNYQISIIINPAGFGPIFADKKITLDYSPTEGLFSTKVVPSTEEDNQYLSLDKKVLWYQFDNDLLSNLTILTFAAKSDTKLETLTTQILSTFKFTDTTPTPTPTTAVNKVKILDSSSWVEYSCSSISYKLPSNYNQKCNLAFNGVQGIDEVIYQENGKYNHGSIMIKKYDGGSRRQNWIDTMKATSSEVSKYVRFQESLFGSVSGLDVFASGGWWQGGYASPILIAHDKTIVYIYGGRDYNEVTGKITRWDISDTIASTIKFL